MTNVEKSNRLKEIRKSLGWDQQRMAQELGLNRSYVSELENAASKGEPTVQDWVVERVEAIARRPKSVQSRMSESQHLGSEVGEGDVEKSPVFNVSDWSDEKLNELQDYLTKESRRSDLDAETRKRFLRSLQVIVAEFERRIGAGNKIAGVSSKVAAGLDDSRAAVDAAVERKLAGRQSRRPKHKTGGQSGGEV